MILLDVGAWLAAVWSRHVHHAAVAGWFNRQDAGLVLCRVTQMSLLRLLTNPAVMGGDTISRSRAWSVVDRLRADSRVEWADEPLHLEPVWRAFSARDDSSHKLWTDDYLAAFAQAADLTLATLDGGFAQRYPSVRVKTLI
ncbi:MAG TPA: TA system VapC family ribonuclease toxin [Candidatus Dormibacteraeota bacterium]|nr:TA system VapC family ribonuclease toxin [Candidatus Dormibacteraeota bacterium]